MTNKAEPKQRHVSDGAMEAMRADIASNRAGDCSEAVRIGDNYIERALDEIAWLRWREGELELAISGKTFFDPTDARVVELEDKCRIAEYELAQQAIVLEDVTGRADAADARAAEQRMRAEEAEGKFAALREDHAMLLAGADADALVIGNLNAHIRKLDGAVTPDKPEVALPSPPK